MANVNILFIVWVGVCDVEVAGPCSEKAILMACVGLAKAKLRKIVEIASKQKLFCNFACNAECEVRDLWHNVHWHKYYKEKIKSKI